MIPILFDTNEVAFTSNGLGRLRDCISCIVTEERNGIYECDFEYPVTGAHYEDIQVGRIVGVTHDDSGNIQPFDIVSFSKPIDGIVTFHCTHISYRQSYYTIKTGSAINSLSAAFTLLGTAQPTNPFSYQTDKTSSGYLAAADGTPRSVRELLGGIEGSILDAYGGEYEFDKWTVYLHSARGQLRNFDIRYGVNMLEYNDETDSAGTYSSVIPYWTDGTEFVVGDKVDSGNSTITGRGECVPLDVSDKFETKPTKAQVESQASSIMSSNHPYLPTQTINVSFVRLQDLGYENLGNLLECRLCDTVNVIFPDYGVSERFKIVKTVYNVLSDRFDEMELGTLSTTLSEALGISNSLDRSGGGGSPSGDISVDNITANGNITATGNITSNGYIRDITESQTLSVNSTYFNLYTAGDYIKLKRSGNVCSITGAVKPASTLTAGDTSYQICSAIPSGYRPTQEINLVMQGSTQYKWLLRISTAGIVSFSRYSVTNSYASPNTNVWLPFHAVWIV